MSEIKFDFNKIIEKIKKKNHDALSGRDEYLNKFKSCLKEFKTTFESYETGSIDSKKNRILHLYFEPIFPEFLGSVIKKNVKFLENGYINVDYIFEGIKKDTVLDDEFIVQLIYFQDIVRIKEKNVLLPISVNKKVLIFVNSKTYGRFYIKELQFDTDFTFNAVKKYIINNNIKISIKNEPDKISKLDEIIYTLMEHRIRNKIFGKVNIKKEVEIKSENVGSIKKEVIVYLNKSNHIRSEYPETYHECDIKIHDLDLEKEFEIEGEILSELSINNQVELHEYTLDESYIKYNKFFKYYTNVANIFELNVPFYQDKDLTSDEKEQINIVEEFIKRSKIKEKEIIETGMLPYNELYLYAYDHEGMLDSKYISKLVSENCIKDKLSNKAIKIEKLMIVDIEKNKYFFANIFSVIGNFYTNIPKKNIEFRIPIYSIVPIAVQLSDAIEDTFFDEEILNLVYKNYFGKRANITAEDAKEMFDDFEITLNISEFLADEELIKGLSDFVFNSKEELSLSETGFRWYHDILEIDYTCNNSILTKENVDNLFKESILEIGNDIENNFKLFYENEVINKKYTLYQILDYHSEKSDDKSLYFGMSNFEGIYSKNYFDKLYTFLIDKLLSKNE